MTDQVTTQSKPQQYRDFNLRFAYYNAADGSFKVWVEGETPGGAMSPNQAVTCTYAPQVFWKEPEHGIGGLLGKLDRRSLAKEGLFELGKLLADLALPVQTIRPLFNQSLAALKAGEGLRLRLRIDVPELMQLPWEFMHLSRAAGEPQPADFLALRREISIVRTDTVSAASRILPNRMPRIVGVLARPTDLDRLNVDLDKAALDTAVKAVNQAAGQALIQVAWVEKPATRTKLEEALKDGADIFQFSGHATFELGQEGKLILEDTEDESDLYPAAQLAQLLGNSDVRLAVLSACESGRRNGKMVWSGVAPALTREKIPAVVANQFDILDTSAILVAARMYPRLLMGYTVDEALFEARQAIYQAQRLEDRDWGVSVLYLHDETGVLFPLPEKVDKQANAQPFLRVARTIDRVDGKTIEAEIKKVRSGQIEVESYIGVVGAGGEAIGVNIDEFGGGVVSAKQEVGLVGEGGNVTGAKIDSLGGGVDKSIGRGLAADSNVEVGVRSNKGKVIGEQKANTFIEQAKTVVIRTEPPARLTPIKNPNIEEKIRVDAAAPNEVIVGEIFDLAVAIRQPASPVLALEDLGHHFSAEGTTFRSKPEEVVRYRVSVSASNCEIYGRSEYVFLLKPCRDSEVVFFQLSAKKPGRLSILVQAYQDDDNLAAMTRVQLIAQIEATR